MNEMNKHLNKLLDDLNNPQEKLVLILRYGLEDNIFRTLSEVGALTPPKNKTTNAQNIGGITRERVRQVIAKAHRKLKHDSRRKLLEKARRYMSDKLKRDINHL